MEPRTTYHFTASAPSTLSGSPARRRWDAGEHVPDAPASRQVFARLAECLTPPKSHTGKPTSKRLRLLNSSGDIMLRELVSSGPQAEKLWAYRRCAEIIREHSKSFYLSARLLPRGKREGVMALYAFCRLSDDLVDNADAEADRDVARRNAATALSEWARMNEAADRHGDHPVVQAWADTRARHSIPAELAEDLLAGIRMDLTISRYETWNDLWVYSYRVASTVGLMSMYITGAETLKAVPYAVQLGVALQLTNILRDVGEDARAGRIYLPAEDMKRFGCTEEMLLNGVLNENVVLLMQFEIARARALYDGAWPGIAMLPADSRMAVMAAATVYRGILAKIEQSAYDVFNRRAHLSAGEKVGLLPGIWWRSSRLSPAAPWNNRAQNTYSTDI